MEDSLSLFSVFFIGVVELVKKLGSSPFEKEDEEV